MSKPAIGEMFLYDSMRPPLDPGEYRVRAGVDVTFEGGSGDLGSDRQLVVEGPRFTLDADEIAGVYPPRNAKGAFHSALPHVVLKRRTLPWERSHGAPFPAAAAGDAPALDGILPWMALLVLEESECTILPPGPLENVVPPAVLDRLGRPAGVTCQAVELDASLLAEIAPSREELALLAHVRRVNVDDRELGAGDSDGWFAVLMSARLPRPASRCVACLVSVEQRTDVIPERPPANAPSGPALAPPIMMRRRLEARPALPVWEMAPVAGPQKARLVLLASWRFEAQGAGTFRELMARLDVGLVGDVSVAGRPPVADTGHIPLALTDRDGAEEAVWYRGPLVPHPLTRDLLGPYQSADQARRVSPETGAEDVSYAAAFEVGRLLAAADGRLGQELLRWRRRGYTQALREDLLKAVRRAMPPPPELDPQLDRAPALVVGAGVVDRFARDPAPRVDPSGLAALRRAPGLDAPVLAEAWGVSVAEARALSTGLELAVEVAEPRGPRPPGSVDDVALDTIAGLVDARRRVVAGAADRLSREEEE